MSQGETMKKNTAFLVCLLMGSLSYADEIPSGLAQPVETIEMKENIVDPLNLFWEKLEKDMSEGTIVEATCAVLSAIKFFKERLDVQEKEIVALKIENESLRRAQNLSDAKYKSLQQIFVAANQYSGG